MPVIGFWLYGHAAILIVLVLQMWVVIRRLGEIRERPYEFQGSIIVPGRWSKRRLGKFREEWEDRATRPPSCEPLNLNREDCRRAYDAGCNDALRYANAEIEERAQRKAEARFSQTDFVTKTDHLATLVEKYKEGVKDGVAHAEAQFKSDMGQYKGTVRSGYEKQLQAFLEDLRSDFPGGWSPSVKAFLEGKLEKHGLSWRGL